MLKKIGKVNAITKTVAKRICSEAKRQARLGIYFENEKIPTLKEFSKEYIKYQRDINQKRSWKKDESHLQNQFIPRFGNLKLSEISVKYIDNFKLDRLKNVTPATVNRELAVLRHLFNLARKWKQF